MNLSAISKRRKEMGLFDFLFGKKKRKMHNCFWGRRDVLPT